jgi:hypothetical protein
MHPSAHRGVPRLARRIRYKFSHHLLGKKLPDITRNSFKRVLSGWKLCQGYFDIKIGAFCGIRPMMLSHPKIKSNYFAPFYM